MSDTYKPTPEDFTFASDELKVSEDIEAVSGVKYEALKKFCAKKINLVGVILIVLIIILSIIGPHISGYDYNDQNLERANMAPRVPVLEKLGILDGSEVVPKTKGAEKQNKYEELSLQNEYYLFGTDSLGRDMFSRCFMGMRISLLIALCATLIDLVIGMNYGIISGYFGGTTDILMQRVIDVIGSIPTLVVVTLLMMVLKPGFGTIIIALMLTGWIEMSLVARSQVLKVKEMEFIQAARTMGAGNMYIIFKELVPNIVGKLITQIMLSIPAAVFLEAFLSFVGLGMPVGTCSLGTLLSDGFTNALLHPYKLVPAATLMIALMVGCHLIAEGMKNLED